MPPKTVKLSTEERLKIVFMAEQGKSHRCIAAELGLNRKTVDSLMKKKTDTGSVDDLKRSGRPRLSSVREDRSLVRESLSNRRLTASDLREIWIAKFNLQASKTTVKSRLNEAGLRGCVAVKKPLLSVANRRARFKFVKERKDWTEDNWDRVLWSDES